MFDVEKVKAELLGEKSNSEIAPSRLNAIAKESGIPLEDLMGWYRDDLEAIAVMPMDQLRFVVADYLGNRDFYLKQQEQRQ